MANITFNAEYNYLYAPIGENDIYDEEYEEGYDEGYGAGYEEGKFDRENGYAYKVYLPNRDTFDRDLNGYEVGENEGYEDGYYDGYYEEPDEDEDEE